MRAVEKALRSFGCGRPTRRGSVCSEGSCQPVVGTVMSIVLVTDSYATETDFYISDGDQSEILFQPTIGSSNTSTLYEVDLGAGDLLVV